MFVNYYRLRCSEMANGLFLSHREQRYSEHTYSNVQKHSVTLNDTQYPLDELECVLRGYAIR